MSNLIKGNVGRLQVTGIPILKWTAAGVVSKNFARSDGIFDPELDSVITLAEAPEYSDLELSTAALPDYVKTFNQWVEEHGDDTNLSCAGEIEDLTFTFTQCSIRRATVFPGFNKNPGGGASSVKTIELVLAVGKMETGNTQTALATQ